jgi:hypothetical protein
MPHSAGENREYVRAFLLKHRPKTIIDIGAGAMMYGNLIKETIKAKTTAIEVWQPYIDFYPYNKVYADVIQKDARLHDDYNVDLVIAGDVLEHMSEEEMKELVDKIRSQAKYLILSVPIIHYPQGHLEDNPYEEHIQEDLNYSELVRILGEPDEYQDFVQTGTYIYKGVSA